MGALSGLTGPMAQEWTDTLADMKIVQEDLAAFKIDATWVLEPEVDKAEIWGCHTTLDWWCTTIAEEGNEPTDDSAIEAAGICGDEAATNEYCAALGVAVALIDADNLISAIISDDYLELTNSELTRLKASAEPLTKALDEGMPSDWEAPKVEPKEENTGGDGKDDGTGDGKTDSDGKGTTDETGKDGDGKKGTEEDGATFMTASAAAIVLGAMLQ